MQTQNPGASASLQSAYDALSSACDTNNLVSSNYAMLGALFAAIEQLAEPQHLVHTLASIGNYLCSDLSNMHDAENAELQANFDKFHAIFYPTQGGRHV